MGLNNKLENPLDKLRRLRNSYLDLLQSCLTGSIYRDTSYAPFGSKTFDSSLRECGLDWPAQAQTMIGTKRMANLRALVETVIADNVPGDLIETGVWRGGACIFMRAILYAHNITDRCVWAADSFAGLPVANARQYPADADSNFHTYEQLAVSLEQVQENFRTYGLLDEHTKFLKGWFKDTLPTIPVERFALIRLDGDMYESTMDALTNLYPKLSHLGYVIVDDYRVVSECKKAVHDYCNEAGILPEIVEIDGVGVYWRKFDKAKDNNASVNVDQATILPERHLSQLHEALLDLRGKAISYLEMSLRRSDDNISTLNKRLAELKQILIARDGDITRLEQELAALYSSTSWRVTKPIRSIKKIIGSPGR